MLTKIKHYIIRTCFFGSVILIGIALTGAVQRDYQVVNNAAQIDANAKYTLDQLAGKFTPHVFISDQLDNSDLEAIKYEVIDQTDKFIINYYYVWSCRTHPSPWENIKLKIKDFIYFKSYTSDIHYIQVTVNKSDFRATQWKYQNGIILTPSNDTRLFVSDWQHAFALSSLSEAPHNKLSMTPVFFEPSEYKNWKMARRSQGDFRTSENKSNIPIIIFLGLIATYYFRHLQKDYNKEYANT